MTRNKTRFMHFFIPSLPQGETPGQGPVACARRPGSEPRVAANANVAIRCKAAKSSNAETRDRTGDLQIFGLTLSQLSYRGDRAILHNAKSYPVSQTQLANSVAKPHLRRLDLSTLKLIASLRPQVLRTHPHQANAAEKFEFNYLLRSAARWPRGPMDKASVYGAGGCRFESCRGHLLPTFFGKVCV